MSATDSVRKLSRACGIWLLLVCMLTFPWGRGWLLKYMAR